MHRPKMAGRFFPARGGRGRGGRAPPVPRGPAFFPTPRPPAAAPPVTITATPEPPPVPRPRMELYASLQIPVDGVMPLSDIAAYAFQKYALFAWLATHTQPLHEDGPTDDELNQMISEGNAVVTQLSSKGPSSIYLSLQGGYTRNPDATERLILLALLADRYYLIPNILELFPNTNDPLRLAALIEPYVQSNFNVCGLNYGENCKKPGVEPSILSSLPDHGLLRGISVLGRMRITQNLILRDMVRARYGMVSVMADPATFNPSSLAEIQALVSKVEAALTSNPTLFSPYRSLIITLKINFEKVKNAVSMGTAITQDAIRRLRILLGVVQATDTLMDKLSPGLPTAQSPKEIASVFMPKPV